MFKKLSQFIFKRNQGFKNGLGDKPKYVEHIQKKGGLHAKVILLCATVPLIGYPLYLRKWMEKDQEEGDWRVKERIEQLEEKRKKRVVSQKKEVDNKQVNYKYILVGGGTASYFALKSILTLDPKAKILIISKEEYEPYTRTPLSKELWFNSSFKIFYDENLFKNYENITYLKGSEASSLNVQDQSISLKDGRSFKYEKLLIATGGSPRVLPNQEEYSEQIKTFRTLDDFKELSLKVQEGKIKDITIIGGSFLGTELAFALNNSTKGRITQIFLEPEILSRNLPRYLSAQVGTELDKIGVSLKPNSNVVSVTKKDSKIILSLDNGEKISSDFVITCMGIYPETFLAETGGLEIDPRNGGIVTNSELEAVHNVYVAGDVLSYHDIVLGRRRSEHHLHAQATGTRAGLNMAGEKKPYQDLTTLWSDAGHIHWEAIGDIDSKLDTYSVWSGVGIKQNGTLWNNAPATPITNGFEKGIVYYLKDSKVIGVLLWNLNGKMDDAKRVILEKKKYSSVEELKNKIQI